MGRKARRNCYCCPPFLSSPGLYQQLPRSSSKQFRSASLDSISNFTDVLESASSTNFRLSGGGNTLGGEYANMYSNVGISTSTPTASYTTASSVKL